ncbi:hypothetical protein OG196_16170 [Kitasatospora purpeofusca]|uniref:hypothetical protein n=1 Tax=Kitasatospora purpeofusca TaxID=67352 RepID=UPI002E1102CE|nr:hypothetical protein OG196_16170 [Kitasatospora purpeofusca]
MCRQEPPDQPGYWWRRWSAACAPNGQKFLNFIIAEVIRHHEAIASDAVTSGNDAV